MNWHFIARLAAGVVIALVSAVLARVFPAYAWACGWLGMVAYNVVMLSTWIDWHRTGCASGQTPSERNPGPLCGHVPPHPIPQPRPLVDECLPPKDDQATLAMILAEMRTQTKIMQANSDTIHADSKRYAEAMNAHGKAIDGGVTLSVLSASSTRPVPVIPQPTL